MAVIAAISVGIMIIGFAAGISWLALEIFFFLLRRNLDSSPEPQRVDRSERLIKAVDRFATLATQ